MAEPYPHSTQQHSARKTTGPETSDAALDPAVAAEHPKGATAPLPPGHPSHGTIDEGGEHTSE